jgi:predicted type IV restriction endonuclease
LVVVQPVHTPEEENLVAQEDRPQATAPPESRREIEALVQRFARNQDVYTRPDYKETQVRVEFIDPFFEALGWDVHNKRGYAEQYKDVVHEDAIKISGATKAPDYCFRVGGVRKFFLEAKKPSTPVKGEVGPAYQLRRYAWSAGLPLSVLTDFEEFAVYDCRQRPKPGDKASVGRVMYLTYEEYLHHLDEIYSIFAREAVLKGSFDRYVEDTKRKRGTSPVDVEFLKEIEGWRDELARNLALRNDQLSVYELNFAVQRTIDRIIFLRMCEDRGIEGYGGLLGLTAGPHIYDRLGELYREADLKYDSDLFDFQADTLTRSLSLDDKTLKPILSGLYYPDCPYEFSVLPPEILGQVYEQFLGKVIRLTAGHRAKVEEKPEVKKAGGVYYTPSYIVEYIVQQTVGRLIEGKTPEHISRLHILDPACGSGSFLLGAYQHLLDHHRRWYEEHDPEKYATAKRPTLYQGRGGEWRLTTGEKKRILLNNIYGVDIDRQAVEVTKLSLLLQVLEGESQETLGQQLKLWRERALPDLGENIKCGNSLIGPDYFEGQLLPDEEEMRRVNPFDWEKEFPQITKAGGFDVVIGNPPYVRIQTMKEWAHTEVELYNQRYAAASRGNYDIYVIFVERALELLNDAGTMGYILPNKFFATDYGRQLRKLIGDRQALMQVVDFGHAQVFEHATTYTCLLFLRRGGSPSFGYARVAPSPDILNDSLDFAPHSSASISDEPWLFLSPLESKLIQTLNYHTVPLLDLPASMNRGSSSGDDKTFILSCTSSPGRYLTAEGKTVELEAGILRVPLFATDYTRYAFNPSSGKVIIFPYRVVGDDFGLLPESELRRSFPNAFGYLQSRRARLDQRKQYKAWYAFSAPRSLSAHDSAHLLIPLLADKGLMAELPKNRSDYCLMASGGFSIRVPDTCELSPRYVLGLLNSSLLFWYLQIISNRFRGGWITCTKQYVGRLPIRSIEFDNADDVPRHDNMVALVERMLELHKKLAAATIPADKRLYERQIEATDAEIDALVYELYGLTQQEVAIVEDRG